MAGERASVPQNASSQHLCKCFPLFVPYLAGKGGEINHSPLLSYMYFGCVFTGGVIIPLFWDLDE